MANTDRMLTVVIAGGDKALRSEVDVTAVHKLIDGPGVEYVVIGLSPVDDVLAQG